MNLASDLENLTKQTKNQKIIPSNKIDDVKNVKIDNKIVKSTKIIKNIVQINPEKIKSLGIADQILAAVRKLDANNDLPPSIDIDLTKFKNINSQKIQTNSKKSLQSLPSTSKASIQSFSKNIQNDNNVKLTSAKGTLNKFLQGRQNANLNNITEILQNTKPVTKRVSSKQKTKSLKSINDDNNLIKSHEIQEEELLNSILNDSTDVEQLINIIDDKNEIQVTEEQNFNISEDNTIINQNNNIQHKNSEHKQVKHQEEPKVRILHEIISEKKQLNQSIENTDDLTSLIIPSFSDSKSHVINTNMNKVSVLKEDIVSKTNPTSTFARRRKIIPSSILNIKKNIDISNKLNNVRPADTNYVTSKVTVNINGKQVTNYDPIMSRKRTNSEIIPETPKVSKKVTKIKQYLNNSLNKIETNLNIQQMDYENINKEQAIKIEKKPSSSIKSEEDGVDFLISLGDSINETNLCNDNSSTDSDDSSICSNNSDFLKKFPLFRNESINADEKKQLTDNDFNDKDDNFVFNVNNTKINSPNYIVPFDQSFQQNQNELILNTITSKTQSKPIVIENKILKDDEKIDLIYLNNIPQFETPSKCNHEIGQTILLQPCKVDNYKNQPFNIIDHTYNESIHNENLIIRNKNITIPNENIIIPDENIIIPDENILIPDVMKNNEDVNVEIITVNSEQYVIEEICTSVNDETNQEIFSSIVENLNDELNNPNDTTKIIKVNSEQIETLVIQENNLVNSEQNEMLINQENNLVNLEPNETLIRQENNLVNLEPNETLIKQENNLVNSEQNETLINQENNLVNLEQNETIMNSENNVVNLERNETLINQENNRISLDVSNINKDVVNLNKNDDNNGNEENIKNKNAHNLMDNIKRNKPQVKPRRIRGGKINLISRNKPVIEEVIVDVQIVLNHQPNEINNVKLEDANLSSPISIDIKLENESVINNQLPEIIHNSEFFLNSSIKDDSSKNFLLEKSVESNPPIESISKGVTDHENIKSIDLVEKCVEENSNVVDNSLLEKMNVAEVIFDEDVSRNSSLNDSLVMEEPFHGFDDTEIKLCNKIFGNNLSNDESEERTQIFVSNQRRNSKNESENLNKSEILEEKQVKQCEILELFENKNPSNEIIEKVNVKEFEDNIDNDNDKIDNDNDKIIRKKPIKRRILDSSEDDEDSIPLKRQEINTFVDKNKQTVLKKRSSTNLNKNIKSESILTTTVKSSKFDKKCKNKIRVNEYDDKNTKNKCDKKKSRLETSNNNKNNNILSVNTDETLKFEENITKSKISTPISTTKRVKKNDNNTKILQNVESENDESKSVTSTPSRGRGRKTVDRKIHPRLLLINNRDEIDEIDKNDKKKIHKNEIQCGMCKEVIINITWDKHKKSHYGIGWKEGETAIDLTSHSAILHSLINYFKSGKNKSLSCRICNKKFGSGLGLLAHLEMCGLTGDEKRKQCYVKCEHCSGEFSRYSLPNHLKICKNLKSKMNLENIDTGDDNNEKQNDNTTIVSTNTGRLKRQSMIRAENKIKDFDTTEFDVADFIKIVTGIRGGQLKGLKKEIELNGSVKCCGSGCKQILFKLSEIYEHTKICKYFKIKNYLCTRCKYHNESIESVRKHILSTHKFSKKDFHSDSDSEVNYDNADNETSTDNESSGVDENFEDDNHNVSNDEESDNNDKKKKNIKSSNKCRKVNDTERFNSNNYKLNVQDAINYFYKYHYSKSILFPNIIVNYKLSDLTMDFFQPKNLLSMKFSFSKKPINQSFNSSKPSTEWIELEQFKSLAFENEKLLFIGGPITSIKWLPTDNDTSTSQYLAITYKRDFNKFVHSSNPHKKRTLILIYKINKIAEFKNKENLGKIIYGITFNDGPINDIEFLPSGGYIPDINRLGLLSIASTNNNIIIYSLPIEIPQNCDNINNNNINLIDLQIGIELKLKLLKNENFKSDEMYNASATKIIWSKAKEHKIIIAGYTNGFIAIWNLTEEDNLNYMEIDDTPTFLPLNYFKASNKSITGLDLHYDSNNIRWLIISTIDRNYKIYDIDNLCNPIIITEDTIKTFITSTIWPFIWENPCYSTSDELYQSAIQIISPLNINFKTRRCSRQSSSINYFSYNNWYNIIACGGNNGDFSIEFNGNINLDTTPKKEKKLNSYTDLIQLNNDKIIDKTSTDIIEFYDNDYRNKYGLIFGPIHFVRNDLTFLQKNRNPPVYMNCYVKINRVDCNNNQNGKQLFAIGYENGFVRILYISKDNLLK